MANGTAASARIGSSPAKPSDGDELGVCRGCRRRSDRPATSIGVPLVSAIRTIAVGLNRLSRSRSVLDETTGTKADTSRVVPKAWVSFSTGMSRSPSFTTAMVSVWPGIGKARRQRRVDHRCAEGIAVLDAVGVLDQHLLQIEALLHLLVHVGDEGRRAQRRAVGEDLAQRVDRRRRRRSGSRSVIASTDCCSCARSRTRT